MALFGKKATFIGIATLETVYYQFVLLYKIEYISFSSATHVQYEMLCRSLDIRGIAITYLFEEKITVGR